jgi:hypothetical protein
MKILTKELLPVLPVFMAFLLSSCSQKGEFTQPELGSRSVKILTKGGYQFKDLNKNKKLDKYEDWRLPADERINDLLSKMTVEEKVGFMIISQINMTRTDAGFTSDLVEEDAVNTTNLFTGEARQVNASGTSKSQQRHLRIICGLTRRPGQLLNGQIRFRPLLKKAVLASRQFTPQIREIMLLLIISSVLM